jgi:hypothetical protein
MRKDENVIRKEYVAPLIEVIEVDVEEGFAMSSVVEIRGSANDFTTNSFNNGNGGSTMGDF